MASPQELHESLLNFQDLFNENEQLRQMNKDWNRVVRISATDTGTAMTVRLQDGTLSVSPEPPAQHHMELVADSELLCALFWGEIGPTEPYMDGRLVVKGSEDDVLRLDFITAMIWGE
jgi:putative sterol carrier protein